jgi:hypothetical protein
MPLRIQSTASNEKERKYIIEREREHGKDIENFSLIHTIGEEQQVDRKD